MEKLIQVWYGLNLIEIQWKAIDRRVKDFLMDTIWSEFPRFRTIGTDTSLVRIRFDKNTIQTKDRNWFVKCFH